MANVAESLPALLGGIPVRPEGPPDWPLADPDILQALEKTYRDGSWGKYHGGNVEKLESRLAEYHSLSHAITCASGTFAVELALRALKVGPGDEVILAAYDYGGNFRSIHAVGAFPVLIDVSTDNWNFDPEKLLEAIGLATRAIIVSHLHGGIVPIERILEIAHERKIVVIEDAAQATGAMVQGRRAGTWGDVGILSFGGSKLMTAGRGGALLTNHADVFQRSRVHLNRGNQIAPLSELQAAVILPQLDKLDERNATREHNVGCLRERLKNVSGLRLFVGGPRHNWRGLPDRPSYYKLGFQFDAAPFGLSRDRFLAAVRAEGIAMDEGFRALHIGRSLGRFRQVGDLKEADRAHQGAVTLHHPVLSGTASDIEQVAGAIERVYANADRLNDTGKKE